tara:strand:- start:643 stop:783 length:141 start_codon:yes stop_codon:yes gene_type:complete
MRISVVIRLMKSSRFMGEDQPGVKTIADLLHAHRMCREPPEIGRLT